MAIVLTLPGWQSSGPEHWQSLWEHDHGCIRVEQHDWMHPLRGDWIARLEEVLLDLSQDGRGVILAAHSLGCIQVAAWASHSRNHHLVKGALLVAPGDVEREDIAGSIPGWAPIPMKRLPFQSILVGSSNDPYCSLVRAKEFAEAWGSKWLDYGAVGHINTESGLGAWPDGFALLQKL